MSLNAGSPFHATITETAPTEETPAAKVKCYGAGLQPNAVRKGQKAVFTVDATQATVSGAPVNVTTTNLNTGRPIYSAGHRKRVTIFSTITMTFLVDFYSFPTTRNSKWEYIFYREAIKSFNFILTMSLHY